MKNGGFGILGVAIGCVAGAVGMMLLKDKKISEKKKKIDKFKNYYSMLNQWLTLKQENKSLLQYFEKNNYKDVAIYGMGELGNRLFEELKNTNVNVVYAIDKEAASVYSSISIYEENDDLPEADVLVVTATFAFEEIVEDLTQKIDIPIVSLEDVIYESF